MRAASVVTTFWMGTFFAAWGTGSGVCATVVRMERSAALFPIDAVLSSFEVSMQEDEPDLPPESLNRLGAALTLAGRASEAERMLAASLRRDPTQGDALFLLGNLWCGMGRLGDARDALSKGYHARSLSNAFEAAEVSTDTCSAAPLLFPPDSVVHQVHAHRTHPEPHPASTALTSASPAGSGVAPGVPPPRSLRTALSRAARRHAPATQARRC